jgi:hypothetical protein
MTGGKADHDASWERFGRVNNERHHVLDVIEAYEASPEYNEGTYSWIQDIPEEARRWQSEKVRL